MLNLRVPEQEIELRPRITVIGVGGGGSNAVNNMIRSELQGVEFLVCNTDAQSLKMSLCERKIQMGTHVTRGLGAGARPEVGRAAAEEVMDDIMGYLEGSNMVFITAGMGGGSGTGGAPVIARAAKEAGILTVGVVTKPFHFEGAHRMRLAEQGIEELQQHVDTLLIIPNQNLFRVANEKTTFADAFKMADEVLHSGVRGVTDLIVMPGLINLDFADIRAVMSEMGKAMMGTGEASGDRRAVEAAEAAINNPLLEDASMQGAKGLLINITGGMDMTLFEVDEVCNRIRDEVDPDANIIFGSTFNPELDGKIRVSVVATGIDSGMRVRAPLGGGFSPEVAHSPAAKTPVAGQFGRGVSLRSGQAAPNMAPNMAPAAAPQAPAMPQMPQMPQMPLSATTNSFAPQQQQQHVQQSPQQNAPINPQRFSASQSTAARVMAAMQNAAATAPQAPVYGYASVGNAALKQDFAPEMDISPVTVGALQEETTDFYAAHQNVAQQVSQWGERDGDSFIPPMPMMTEAKPISSAPVGGYASAPAPQAASQMAPSMAAPAVASPVEEKAVTEKAEKPAARPSLFDRMMGGSSKQAAPAVAAPLAQPTSQIVTQTTPQNAPQASLVVDNSDRMPASSFDDDLDIPAFLRRQAS